MKESQQQKLKFDQEVIADNNKDSNAEVINVNGAVANEEVKSRISWTERVQSPIWHHPLEVFQTHKSISINKIKRTVMHEYSVSRQGITASAPYLQRTVTPMA